MPRVSPLTIPTLDEARARILALAEPVEPIAVSLGEALGLSLAEPVVADIDHPPSDRAAYDGFAVHAADATTGTWLRVVAGSDHGVEPGETVPVRAGDPLPDGADAVLRRGDVRLDREPGSARVVEVVRGAEPGRGRTARGSLLTAGAVVAPEGTTLRPAHVALLASQGAVHPLCHRRVRVALVAVGDHWIPPAEEPALHRERNVTNAALVALLSDMAASPHDLQAVAPDRLRPALERATLAPVVIVLGRSTRATRRELALLSVEPVLDGTRVRPGGRVHHGVIRDHAGQVLNHIFQLPTNPIAAVVGFTLLVRPLIARLQGQPAHSDPGAISAVWDGEPPASSPSSLTAKLVTLRVGLDARLRATPVPTRGVDDLAALAQADGVGLIRPGSDEAATGKRVEVVPFRWPS